MVWAAPGPKVAPKRATRREVNASVRAVQVEDNRVLVSVRGREDIEASAAIVPQPAS